MAFGLFEPHTIWFGPWMPPLQILLQSLPALKLFSAPAQLSFAYKLTESNKVIQYLYSPSSSLTHARGCLDQSSFHGWG